MKKYACLLAFAVWGLTAVGQAAGPAVYLNEARNNPFERNMFIDDTGETFRYTAFYKGALQPGEDIACVFMSTRGKSGNTTPRTEPTINPSRRAAILSRCPRLRSPKEPCPQFRARFG